MPRLIKYLSVSLPLVLLNLINLSAQESRYYDEFYNALNSLLHSKYSKISQIIDKSWNIYRTAYGDSPYPTADVDTPPPPPPPGNIYYNRSRFNYFVLSTGLDSRDVDYMYKSIDSTKTIFVDQKRTNLRVIPWDNVYKILRNSEGDFKKADDIIEKAYGARNFIIVSVPLFNADYTSLVITIKTHIAYEDIEGITYIMKKKRQSWKVLKERELVTRRKPKS